MPNLPDFPGRDLVEGSTRRAGAIVGAAAGGAYAVGGFVVKKVLSRRGDDARPDATASNGPPPMVHAGEGRRTAAKPKPAPPSPKQAKPKPAPPRPKAAKPKPPKPEADKSKPAPPNPEAGEPKLAPPKPAAAKPKPAQPKPPKADKAKPKIAKPKAGTQPGDQRGGKDPHHALNNPVADPDETEYPDPYDKREDPRDPVDPDDAPFGAEPHPPTGAESTSEPPPAQDPEAGDRARPPRRENLDD